jgi:hypothetical protein
MIEERNKMVIKVKEAINICLTKVNIVTPPNVYRNLTNQPQKYLLSKVLVKMAIIIHAII